jgi:hypothetical protein
MDNHATAIVTVQWSINSESALASAMREYGVRRLASECDVSPQSVSNWLAGAPMPDGKLAQICGLVGSDVPGFALKFNRECRLDIGITGTTARARMIRKRAGRRPAGRGNG